MKNSRTIAKSTNALFSLLFVICLGSKCVAQDGNRSLLPKAQEYINAYYAGNTQTSGQHMHDSIQWSDHTSKEVGTYILEVKGKNNVINHIKKMTRDILTCEFIIDHSFESDVYTIFEGDLKYSWQDYQSKKVYDFNIRSVVILTFEGDKIIKHEDYADFKTLGKQFHEQK